MSDVSFQTARPLKRALASNSSAAAYTGRIPQVLKPSGNTIVPLADLAGQVIPGRVHCLFIGLGADNDAFNVKVWAWSRLGQDTSPTLGIWIPRPIIELAATVGTTLGVSGAPLLATERLADTIAITKEPTTTADVTRLGNTDLYSVADNTPAWVEFRTWGAELLDFEFARVTGTPTMNALIEFMAENH